MSVPTEKEVKWRLVFDAIDANATIECPFCRAGNLSIRHGPYTALGPEHPVAYWIKCTVCGEGRGYIPHIPISN